MRRVDVALDVSPRRWIRTVVGVNVTAAVPDVRRWHRFQAGHVLSSAGDATLPVALAGTMLLAGSGADRRAAAMALLVAVIPAAIAAPLVAAAVRRVRSAAPLLPLATAARAITLTIAAFLSVTEHVALLAPVFACVVIGKAHSVLRCSTVPLVAGPGVELIGANARLSRVSTLGVGAGVITALALVPISPAGALIAGACAHAAATCVLWPFRQVSAITIEDADAGTGCRRVPAKVRTAQGSLVAIEAGSGALLVLIMAGVAAGDLPAVALPAAAVVAGAGNFGATWLAPRLRARYRDPHVVVQRAGWATVVVLAATSVLLASAGLPALVVAVAAAAGGAMGVVNQVGRSSFDATVQEAVSVRTRSGVFAVSDAFAQFAYAAGGLLVLMGGFPMGARLAVVAAAGASWIAGHGVVSPRRARRSVVRPVAVAWVPLPARAE